MVSIRWASSHEVDDQSGALFTAGAKTFTVALASGARESFPPLVSDVGPSSGGEHEIDVNGSLSVLTAN